MYLLKLAARPWRIAPMSQVFSSLAVGMLLCIAGFLFWMEQGLQPVIARLQSEQVITAYLSPDVAATEEGKITDSIRIAVGSSARNVEVKQIGVSEFVGQLREHYPELTRELESFGSEMTQVVPRYISVAGSLTEAALDQVKAVQGVESAESSRDRHQHIVGAFVALRWVARLLILGLAIALLTGLIHLAKMNGYLHQDALNLMRLWGGGGLDLRFPGMLSGLIVGVVGGAFASGTWAIASQWLAKHVLALSPMLQGMPQPSIYWAAVLFVAGAVIGVSSGALALEEARAK